MSVRIPWRRNKNKSSDQGPGEVGAACRPPDSSDHQESVPLEKPEVNRAEIEEAAIEALRTVYDPEIPVNIYELGLVYAVEVGRTGEVVVRMTLTSPGCPVAVSLPIEVESKVQMIPGVTSAKVELVWDPIWGPEKMSDAARLQLGFF
jgi:FeS assembly SUF system protein